MASARASTSRGFHLTIPLTGLRPSWSEENVPLNLGIDEDEVSPATRSQTPAPEVMEGRDAWARFSLGWDDDDADSVIGEGDFDCHICLRTATNPCVTRCGHLFCYDDLEQWLRIHPRCPVCSSFISLQHDVVKIFGRGREQRRKSSSASSSQAPSLVTKDKPPTAPASSAPSLPSPPATPSPPRPPSSLPDATTSELEPAGAARSPRPLVDKDRPIVQPPHPLLVEQLLRHQFARILSLVALVFFLLLIGLQRS